MNTRKENDKVITQEVYIDLLGAENNFAAAGPFELYLDIIDCHGRMSCNTRGNTTSSICENNFNN